MPKHLGKNYVTSYPGPHGRLPSFKMEDEVKGKENGEELCNGKDTVEQESDSFDENGGKEEQKGIICF